MSKSKIQYDARSLADWSKEDLKTLIGRKVQKFSGKPFSNGEKVAEIQGVIRHPYTGRAAFVFVDAKFCEALRCYLV